jgi:Tol biopolymer transport system component
MTTERRSRARRARWAVGVVIAALACAGAAQSTTPGANGLIVYGQEVGPEHFELFTVRPDGTGRRRITRGSASSLNADWAPNGRSIVYEIDRASGAAVAVRSSAGGQPRILTPKGFQGNPSFSPDRKWIVYVREAGGNGIWLMRANGTGLRRLTRNPFAVGVDAGSAAFECGCDEDPNFSPDGKLVSFVRIKKDREQQALFVVRRNGTGLRQLTPYSWEVAVKHDWSPDGKLILLTTNADFVQPGASANMVTIRPDGSGKTELTHFTGGMENAFAGSFSPDGKQIVFRLEDGDTYSLAVADRDGGNVRRLTTGPGKPRFIDWGTSR